MADIEIPAELVEQFAVYMQRRDAFEQGMVGADGVARPSWDDLGEAGWNAYLKDSVAYVTALVHLGMRPAPDDGLVDRLATYLDREFDPTGGRDYTANARALLKFLANGATE